MRKKLTKIFWNIEVWAVQKHVNLVDLVKSFPTNIYLQNLASIQKRTSPIKFAHLAEKSEKGSISNLSTKAQPRDAPARPAVPAGGARVLRGVSRHLGLHRGVARLVPRGPAGERRNPMKSARYPRISDLALGSIDARFCNKIQCRKCLPSCTK